MGDDEVEAPPKTQNCESFANHLRIIKELGYVAPM